MGLAWKANNQFPWETIRYEGGIENVKVNVTLRIFSNKWHVYAGLAIMNPSAQAQITQYAASVTDLFKLMTEGKEREFSHRVKSAGKFVFGDGADARPRLLRDELLDQFSLSGVPKSERVPNNQLALLSMVDCWWKLGLNPYDHMICSTPVLSRCLRR
jgi:prephenate dehydrogenase (NADP+)